MPRSFFIFFMCLIKGTHLNLHDLELHCVPIKVHACKLTHTYYKWYRYHKRYSGCKRGKRCCLHPSAKTYTDESLDKSLHKHSLNLHDAGLVTPSCVSLGIFIDRKKPPISRGFSRIPTDLVVLWDTPYAYPLSGNRSGLGHIHTRDIVDETI